MLQKVEEGVGTGKGDVEGAAAVGGVGKGSEMHLDDASVMGKLIVVVSEKGSGDRPSDGGGGLWGNALDPEVGGDV